jgi:hypothetical protein
LGCWRDAGTRSSRVRGRMADAAASCRIGACCPKAGRRGRRCGRRRRGRQGCRRRRRAPGSGRRGVRLPLFLWRELLGNVSRRWTLDRQRIDGRCDRGS